MSVEESPNGALRMRGRWGWRGRVADLESASEGTHAARRQTLHRMFRNRLSIFGFATLGLIVVAVLVGPSIWTTSPTDQDLGNSLASPSGAHPFGTDTNGRDVLARLLHGGRVSIAIALVAITGATMVGALVGLVAGFTRGLLDGVLMRTVDVMLALPSLLLALAIVAIAGPGLVNVAIAVGIGNTPFFARLTRSVVISVRERDYVLAARAAGVRRRKIMTRHVLRNSLSPVIVAAALAFGFAILEVATLGFLGFGVQPPQAEWGAMLVDANQYLFASPAVLIVPGLAIALTAISANLVGDAMNDALDPSG